MNGSNQRHQLSLSRYATILVPAFLASSTVVLWGILKRRARRKAQELASLAQGLVREGSLVDCNDVHVRAKILNAAINRALTFWHHLHLDEAQPMKNQVGGLGSSLKEKKRLLTVPTDYALKPLHVDERGFREIAFYESLRLAHHSESSVARRLQIEYGHLPELDELAFACESSRSQKYTMTMALSESNMIDHLAMQIAVFSNDALVQELDDATRKSWMELRDEIDLLRQLSGFVPSYYGIIGQTTSTSYEISSDSYIIMSDITANFSKPCVLDLKMGQKTYERDAHYTKREREISKYEQQVEFGFRIVGMRPYDPLNDSADEDGFVFYDKHYGRSLLTLEAVILAFETFFKTYNDPELLRSYEEEAAACTSGREFQLNDLRRKWKIYQYPLRADVLNNVIEQLMCILEWFEDNERFVFRSSSLLFVFGGDLSQPHCDIVNVKMIDFGHVQRGRGLDEGYLYGLKNLISILHGIVNGVTGMDNDN